MHEYSNRKDTMIRSFSKITWACEKTVVMWKHPGHLTSMKKLFGVCINLFNLCFLLSSLCDGNRRSGMRFVN